MQRLRPEQPPGVQGRVLEHQRLEGVQLRWRRGQRLGLGLR